MEKEKNIGIINYYLKVNIYMVIKKKEKNIMIMVNYFMKVNIYLIKNGMVKDMIQKEN